MKKKINIIRNLETVRMKSQIIREQNWKSVSVGGNLNGEYIEALSAQIDEILDATIINLKKKEQDNAER